MTTITRADMDALREELLAATVPPTRAMCEREIETITSATALGATRAEHAFARARISLLKQRLAAIAAAQAGDATELAAGKAAADASLPDHVKRAREAAARSDDKRRARASR